MPKKITIRGTIGWSENATPEFLSSELAAANGDDIELEFSSPGGFVYPGIEMANMVRNYSGRIVAKITGLAASMSSYIPMMADEVVVEDNAVYMIHNVSGIEWGDHRALEKYAKHLRGLRNILAKAYVNKTGKSIEDIKSLMDDETFFYGNEIVESGFADSSVESAGDGDKDTAMILAKEEIKNCTAVMKENEVKFTEDLERAVAFFNKEVPQPPVKAGKPKEEASIMNFAELMAANPEAKAEHDGMIAAARAEGETEGKAKMEQAFTAALPILSSDSYPETVKTRVTAKAIAGDFDGLQDFVAIHDMNIEAKKEDAAKDDSGEETPPETPDALSSDGSVSSPDQLAGAIAQHKDLYGAGGTK